jgi:hypothetical protein
LNARALRSERAENERLHKRFDVKRAGTAALERIASLLEELRTYAALRERTPGHFFLGPHEVLHFHDDPAGVFADLRLSGRFVRLPVSTPAEQAELLGRVAETMEAFESRNTGRMRRRRRPGDSARNRTSTQQKR